MSIVEPHEHVDGMITVSVQTPDGAVFTLEVRGGETIVIAADIRDMPYAVSHVVAAPPTTRHFLK